MRGEWPLSLWPGLLKLVLTLLGSVLIPGLLLERASRQILVPNTKPRLKRGEGVLLLSLKVPSYQASPQTRGGKAQNPFMSFPKPFSLIVPSWHLGRLEKWKAFQFVSHPQINAISAWKPTSNPSQSCCGSSTDRPTLLLVQLLSPQAAEPACSPASWGFTTASCFFLESPELRCMSGHSITHEEPCWGLRAAGGAATPGVEQWGAPRAPHCSLPSAPPGKQCGGGHWGAPLGQVPGSPYKKLGCCKHCGVCSSELFGVPRGMGQRRHKKCHVTRCLGTASHTSYHLISFWKTVNFLCLQIHQKTNIPM